MMGDPFTVNRQLQVGVESTSGTGVAATKQFVASELTLDPTLGTAVHKGAGRRFSNVVVPDGQEITGGKLTGVMNFIEMAYWMSMIWGAPVITTPSGGVNAKQFQWIVPVTGKVNPKTMTIERGDADDAERVTYAALTDIGFDISRTAANLTGNLVAQALQKAGDSSGWTGMTAGLSPMPTNDVLPNKWAVYLDTQPQGAGTGTKLTRCFKAVLAYGGAFVPYFPVDNAQNSFAGLADGDALKATMALTILKGSLNSTPGEALWAPMRAGQVRYIRLLATGDSAENFRTIAVTGTPTGGSFTIVYNGVTSGSIAYNSTSTQLQAVLDAMSSIGAGNSVASGGPLPGTALRVDFKGPHLDDGTGLVFTLGTNSLTGGTSPAPAFAAPIVIPSSFQFDMAGKVSKPGAEQDLTSTRVRDWTFEIVEDPLMNAGAGGAIIVTLVTSLQSL